MTGKLTDFSYGRNRKQRITIELDQDFRDQYDELADVIVDVTIKKHFNRRSLSANAYFHVLVNKIAAKQNIGDDACKAMLVMEYGALARTEDGQTVGFKLPSKVDVTSIYPYAKCFDTREEDGILFNCYLVYKETHTMDSKEMARLIDGAVYEAKELGIETDTPEQLARYKWQWAKAERRSKNE
jgi:hypothetical protein